MQRYNRNNDPLGNEPVSNNAIIITAVSCLGGLVLVIGVTLMLSQWYSVNKVPPSNASQDSGVAETQPTEFSEGYSIILPSGFQGESRREYENGNIVYRFNGEERCKMTFAIVKGEGLDQFARTPDNYSEALVESVPELSEGIDGKILAERVSVDGMPASLFRFYEKETYRGVSFTYYMVAMDYGTKLAVKITGKHGGYDENEKNIVMPEHWYDSMLTLKHVR